MDDTIGITAYKRMESTITAIAVADEGFVAQIEESGQM
jgi:hypothetical protein